MFITDLAVRGDVKSPERMEDKDWCTPAPIPARACAVLELLPGKTLFRMSEELKKNWSEELCLRMLCDTLGQDSTNDDSARLSLENFILAEYERSDVTNFEVSVIEEITTRCIQ